MSETPAIIARDLRKTYKVYKKPSGRLLEWATLGRAKRHQTFDALRGVSLEVPRGQCLGVIGKNGCGKSTLLKLLSGVLSPTGGSYDVRGRVFALIELGTGFNPHLSGSQNIDLASGLLGLDPGYVKRRKDQIIEFSELEQFIDRPMRTYSSGMRARLSFSLYAFMEPDVLMIDEAFSVGDASFREKSYDLIERMVGEQSRTVVFVSHSIGAITRLSQRVAWIESGLLKKVGEPEEVTSEYLETVGRARRRAGVDRLDSAPVPAPEDRIYNASDDAPLRGAWIELRAGKGVPRAAAYERFVLGALLRAPFEGPSHAWMRVHDADGALIAQADTQRLGQHAREHAAGAEIVTRWPWRPLGLSPGTYRATFGLRPDAPGRSDELASAPVEFEVEGSRVVDSTYHVILTPRVHVRENGSA